MPKKILLGTGLSGLLGSRVQQLFQDEYEFQNMDVTQGIDILDEKAVDAAVSSSDSNVLLHMAAYTNVSAAHEEQGDKNGLCYKLNVEGTRIVARAAKKYHKYFIHLSTDYVFDGEKDTAYDEDDEPHPIEWYGQTKLWAEEVVREELDNYVILRTAYPYQVHPKRADFLARLREGLETDSLHPMFVDHFITPTFADDLARVFIYCADHTPQGIYHAVGSSWHSDFEMALIVKNEFGYKGTIRKGYLDKYLKTLNRPYQRQMRMSNTKLQKDFGLSMLTFEEGVREVKQQLDL